MKDFMGACLSGLCILHCLLTPLLLAMGGAGMIGTWLGSEWVHYALIAPICILLSWSLPLAWVKHRQGGPLLIGVSGLSLLLLSLWLPGDIESLVAIVGSLGLITAHLLNRHLLNRHLLKKHTSLLLQDPS